MKRYEEPYSGAHLEIEEADAEQEEMTSLRLLDEILVELRGISGILEEMACEQQATRNDVGSILDRMEADHGDD